MSQNNFNSNIDSVFDIYTHRIIIEVFYLKCVKLCESEKNFGTNGNLNTGKNK